MASGTNSGCPMRRRQVLPAVQTEVIEEQQRGHRATLAPPSRGGRPRPRPCYLVVARRLGAVARLVAERFAGLRRFGSGVALAGQKQEFA